MSVLFYRFLPSAGHFPGCVREGDAYECPACKRRAYTIALVLGLLGAGAEIAAGAVTESLSLLSDGFHLLFDNFGFVIGLFSLAHVRHERLWEVVMAGFFFAAVAYIGWHGYESLAGGDHALRHPALFLTVALFGLGVNAFTLWMFQRLRLGHAHHGAECRGSPDPDRVFAANFWHTASDLAVSLAVIAVALANIFFPTWKEARYLDPIVALAVALFLFFQSLGLLKRKAEAGPHRH